jgi:hypothetical protein
MQLNISKLEKIICKTLKNLIKQITIPVIFQYSFYITGSTTTKIFVRVKIKRSGV